MVRKLCGKSSFQDEKIRYNLVGGTGGTGWLVNHQIVSSLHRLIPLYEEQEQDFERQKYVRSISEPPQAATLSLAATPVRKLSECEQRSNKLTGLFFQV